MQQWPSQHTVVEFPQSPSTAALCSLLDTPECPHCSSPPGDLNSHRKTSSQIACQNPPCPSSHGTSSCSNPNFTRPLELNPWPHSPQIEHHPLPSFALSARGHLAASKFHYLPAHLSLPGSSPVSANSSPRSCSNRHPGSEFRETLGYPGLALNEHWRYRSSHYPWSPLVLISRFFNPLINSNLSIQFPPYQTTHNLTLSSTLPYSEGITLFIIFE